MTNRDLTSNPLFQRSLPLLSTQGALALQKARLAIFGLGGVGSYAAEALARSGIGNFELIDKDIVEPSNLNRQLCATRSTIGLPKVEVMKNRILEINPDASVSTHQIFYNAQTGLDFLPTDISYIVDAIDTLQAKIDLIIKAKEKKISLISALGAGNKYDPTAFIICDIFDTYNDPLAKRIRIELRKHNISEQAVVFSPEKPQYSNSKIIASLAYVPPVSGLICAAKVIQDLAGIPTIEE